ncbi:MAG: aminopeptidase P family N-terminal domain-containing protein, partial [Armatimonadota bacterium]
MTRLARLACTFPLIALPVTTARAQHPTSPEDREAEVREKEQRLMAYMEQHNLGAVMISTLRNFSWITGGGDTHIVITSEAAPISLLITAEGRKYLIANGSEAPRLLDEQLAGLGYELEFYKWYADKGKPNERDKIIKRLTKGKKLASDADYPGAKLIPDPEFAELRVPLTESEIERYRWLGRECGLAVKETA